MYGAGDENPALAVDHHRLPLVGHTAMNPARQEQREEECQANGRPANSGRHPPKPAGRRRLPRRRRREEGGGPKMAVGSGKEEGEGGGAYKWWGSSKSAMTVWG